MTIRGAFWPMGGKREACPYNPNQKLLDIRPSSTSAVSGSIEILADGRFKLELEAAGGAGSGWQDENIWAGGGSAAAIVVEVILPAGKYLYSVPGKTKASGFWTSGGSGGTAYFKSSNASAVNFKVTGGQSSYGKTQNAGGTVSSFTGTVKKTVLKKTEILPAVGLTSLGQKTPAALQFIPLMASSLEPVEVQRKPETKAF